MTDAEVNVMRRWPAPRTLGAVQDSPGIGSFELIELRLHENSSRAAAVAVVAHITRRDEHPIPVLSSIEDRLDVAVLRVYRRGALDGDRGLLAALSPHASPSRPAQHYRSRLAVSTAEHATYFRLAVTDTAINDREPTGGRAHTPPAQDLAELGVQLLWIGEPSGSPAGLMVLTGHAIEGAFGSDRGTGVWPLPLSADLGVRIYAGTCE